MPFALSFLILLATSAPGQTTGPWKLSELRATPTSSVTKTDPQSNISVVYYENVPLGGKPTRVFAYYAVPKQGKGPFPAMVLIHGGGGKAFREWAALWADRGYAAIAMDLSGRGPDGKRLPDGGPEQSDDEKFRDFGHDETDQMWTYHAVAAAIRAHSFLASRTEVDPQRIGVSGISWGGYLTCIVAGVDDRFKVAVPVYGCGFLDENSAWLDRFKKMGAAKTRRWSDLFDPSRYLPGVSCPILFVNGTNDFAYPLDSYQKSYRLVEKVTVDLCVTVKMPHGHVEGWKPKEIGLFVDSILVSGKPLPRISTPTLKAKEISARVDPRGSQIRRFKIHSTTDTGPWQTRNWTTSEATLSGTTLTASLPESRPIVGFFTIEDERGAVSSSPHLTIEK